ncbi:MAG: type II toxin-antitoxin system VapC family toxin [Chloroflexota bacterium]
MLAALADTHAAIWYVFNDPRLSPTARSFKAERTSAGHEIGVSAITVAEIVYLVERGRVPPDALLQLVAVLRSPEILLTEVPVSLEIGEAMTSVPGAVVPDMPDRIIAASALHLGVPLISRDRKIRLTAVETIW